jgi:hypothetical protein
MAITKLDVKMIQATGTPSSNTWLRGDGSWQTITLSPYPVWATQAGSIAIANEQAVFSANLLAVDRNSLTISYSIISGSLPSGLSLNASTGAITGTTPQVTSNTLYSFTINASNGTQTTARTFSITVNNSTNEPPVWSTAAGSLGSVNSNTSFNYNLSATDPNSDPITYSITSGALPTGLSMSSLGVITGTTSTISSTTTSNFTVSANDGHGGITNRAFSITVVFVVPTINYTISANSNNVDFRTLMINAGWNGTTAVNGTVTVNSGVYIGSASTTTPGFNIAGPFPSGSTLTLINNGFICGRGGPPGTVDGPGYNTLSSGGDALHVGVPVTIYNNNCIWAGGGGGGSAHAGDLSPGGGLGGAGGGYPYPGHGYGNPGDPGGAGGGIATGFNVLGLNGADYASGGYDILGGGGGGVGGEGGSGSPIAGQSTAYGRGYAGYFCVGMANVTWAVQGNAIGKSS